jgi:endogenous inhibitor of DNA gyrase (YacG/DUF329 family)
MSDPTAAYTARCDTCAGDAEWTTVLRCGRNFTTVTCPRCGTAEFHGATVVPLPPGPVPAAYPTADAWGRASA